MAIKQSLMHASKGLEAELSPDLWIELKIQGKGEFIAQNLVDRSYDTIKLHLILHHKYIQLL